jgi:hypothetical protein
MPVLESNIGREKIKPSRLATARAISNDQGLKHGGGFNHPPPYFFNPTGVNV